MGTFKVSLYCIFILIRQILNSYKTFFLHELNKILALSINMTLKNYLYTTKNLIFESKFLSLKSLIGIKFDMTVWWDISYQSVKVLVFDWFDYFNAREFWCCMHTKVSSSHEIWYLRVYLSPLLISHSKKHVKQKHEI